MFNYANNPLSISSSLYFVKCHVLCYTFLNKMTTEKHICPVANMAKIMGDVCTILIIRDLLERPKRFSDLHASLVGISTRTLTKKLKFLEEMCIIEKQNLNEKPPRTEYALTKKGKDFRKIINEMRKYGEMHS